jgi:hypothetical protein
MNKTNKKLIIFKQAKSLLDGEDECLNWRLKQAKSLMVEIEKQAGLFDWLKNPMIQTVLSLLNPLIGKSYKISQAVKLILEAFKEMGK